MNLFNRRAAVMHLTERQVTGLNGAGREPLASLGRYEITLKAVGDTVGSCMQLGDRGSAPRTKNQNRNKWTDERERERNKKKPNQTTHIPEKRFDIIR